MKKLFKLPLLLVMLLFAGCNIVDDLKVLQDEFEDFQIVIALLNSTP